MNRIAHADMYRALPRPDGTFTTDDAQRLLVAYCRDPSDVACPRCGPDTIEVLAFLEPKIDSAGFAMVTGPEGEYAVALYCHGCRRGIGVRAVAHVD